MLTYDSLIIQAKLRGMPPTKIRGILREYLQILILKEIYKLPTGRELYFTGGTYLRLIHNLKRFSEDLDFNTNSIRKSEFESLMKQVNKGLKRRGMKLKIEFTHWRNVYVSKLIFPEIERIYGVISKYSKKKGIIIKVETNSPKFKVATETQLMTGFGETHPCICTNKSILFADKIDAFCKKRMGRHIYDVIFMLINKFPIDKKVLEIFGIKEDPLKVIFRRIKHFSKNELRRQAEALRPFLFEESESDLITNAQEVIPLLLEKYHSSLL
jgi:predicted nucleotidyltransferase component of viral defense system